MKKLFQIFITLSLFAIFVSCASVKSSVKSAKEIFKDPHHYNNIKATFVTTQGEISFFLYPDASPYTVANFINLGKRGYYDNTKFFRYIDNFIIQGGDTTETGTGGPRYTIPDEIVGWLDFYQHGMLAMATAGPNTGGSQFFITLGPTDWLDNKHTIFGTVVQGMDVVEKIGKVKTGRNDKPVEPVIINTITLEPITDDAKNGK